MISREEAIRILDPKTTREALAEIEYHAGFNGQRAVMEAVNEACVIGAEAIQRLIPQPVDKFEPIIEVNYGTPYSCPECGCDVNKVYFITADGSKPKEKISYCWRCGQAIDWSECDD